MFPCIASHETCPHFTCPTAPFWSHWSFNLNVCGVQELAAQELASLVLGGGECGWQNESGQSLEDTGSSLSVTAALAKVTWNWSLPGRCILPECLRPGTHHVFASACELQVLGLSGSVAR